METKQNKKDVTFDGLLQELDKANDSKKFEVKKVADIFGRINNVKDIKKEEVITIFDKVIGIAGKQSWMFLLEIYSRFYNRQKEKKQKEIISLIEIEVQKYLDCFIKKEETREIIHSIANDDKSLLLMKKIGMMGVFCNETKISKQELIAYLYLNFLIFARKECLQINRIDVKISKTLFSNFAEEEKQDPLFVKDIKKSLFEGNFFKKCKEITYLYDGLDDELIKVKANCESKDTIIEWQSDKISEQKDYILKLEQQLNEKNQELEANNAKLQELEILLKKAGNRNEYNENLYKQQFLSFKDSLVENLKQNLRLEIEGLEEIADSLNEVQKERIQRRIDRIYKKIEKAGE